MEGKIDKYYPVVGGAVIALLYLLLFHLCPKLALNKGFRDILIAAITVNAIAVGFLATAKATLMSIYNSRVIKWMKSTNTYVKTIIYFGDAVNASIFCGIYSMILLLIDFSNPIKHILFLLAVWVFLMAIALLAMHRIIRIFSKILRKAD
ncbi:MAG: hypothetical protein WCW53_06760 [Syntrophales bacterium]